MTKKNDKRLCWNCDGSVSIHLAQCPYCGVDLSQTREQSGEKDLFQGFTNPFQNSSPVDQSIPKPPFACVFNQELTVSEDEWNQSFKEEAEESKKEEEKLSITTKREMIALLLLLPGVVFFLFGLTLFLFSSDGVLTLEWNQSFAYFYFLGAVPLLFLGWRALR
ncbi:MAG: hypothetical protein JJU12_02865 [Chlamydiales bacterium]|nr:hypothetical protein [Chlamydiales bacterium]